MGFRFRTRPATRTPARKHASVGATRRLRPTYRLLCGAFLLVLVSAASSGAAVSGPVDIAPIVGRSIQVSSYPGAVAPDGSFVGFMNWHAPDPNESGYNNGGQHPFLWTAGDSVRDLGTLGGHKGYAAAVNASGMVVGASTVDDADTVTHGFVWTASGGMRDVGTLPGDTSSALIGVNASGQFVGSSGSGPGTHVVLGNIQGGLTDLGPGNPVDLNDAGEVLVYQYGPASGLSASLWSASTGMRDIGSLGGVQTYARDMNASGQIVGFSKTTSGSLHAFLWDKTAGMQDLDGGSLYSYAWAINDAGAVVGQRYGNRGGSAYLWTAAGGMIDLGTDLPANLGSQARAISENGTVGGYFDGRDGHIHGFAWQPSTGAVELPPVSGGNGVYESRAVWVTGNTVIGQTTTAESQDSEQDLFHVALWTLSGSAPDGSIPPTVTQNGQTLTSDTTGSGATSSTPIQTAITTPVGGNVAVTTGNVSTSVPSYNLLGSQVNITAPAANSASAPLVIKFTIDASRLVAQPDGSIPDSDTLTVFRTENGVTTQAGECPGATTAPADGSPCISARATIGGGDVQLTLLTLHASTWNLGVRSHLSYSGFFQPVDNLPVLNVAKAGSAIPVKFGLGGNQGLKILAAGYPKSQSIPCNSTAPVDGIEQTVTPGASPLTYDAKTGQYSYVWKTASSWSTAAGGGPCRELTVKLSDGTKHYALFKFK